MPIDLYYTPGSPPCITVLLAAKAVDVDLNLKQIDMRGGENRTPEFLKINPQHTIPTLVDGGLSLWESRAIITYLQNQYGKTDTLYPKDPKKRALVDQRLQFDLGTLYSRLANAYLAAFFGGTAVDPQKVEKVTEALQILDAILENSKFSAGDSFTLADISLVVSVIVLDMVGQDIKPYGNIAKWLSLVKKTAPGFQEIYENNLLIFKQFIDKMKK